MPLTAEFLDALDEHPIPHLVVGDDGTILSVNAAAARLVGAGAREMIGRPWQSLLRGSELDRAGHLTLPASGEWHLTDQAGAAIRCNLSTLPIEVVDGASGLVAITDLRSTDEVAASLRTREMSLRDLADGVPGALVRYTLQPDGTDVIDYVSHGCFDLWEVEAEEVERSSAVLWDQVIDEDVGPMRESIVRSSEDLAPWFHEWRTRTPSGKDKWLQGSGRPRRLADGCIEWHAFILDITERKEHDRAQERVIQRSRDQLRRLAARLQEVREEERKELARDLHDQVGQYLTVMGMDLHQIGLHGPVQGAAREHMNHLSMLLDETVGIVQMITGRLRPPVLDELGLGRAIAGHVTARLESPRGVEWILDVDEDDGALRELDSDRAMALFRVFQESTTNVLRHSNASKAWIRLRAEDGAVVLEVEDDGDGITDEQLGGAESLGLIGMRERVASIGGTLEIGPREGGGTSLRAVAPLETSVG